MAITQHKDIPDSQLHEPKGAATAAGNSVYVASGSGSGTWRRVGSDLFLGMSGDAGVVGNRLLSNGTNGLTLVADAAYGTAAITTNTTNFLATAAADATLKTPEQFQLFSGTGAPWASANLFNMTFSVDRLTAPVAGVYRADISMSIKAFPTISAKIATKFRVNGTTFTTRNHIAKSNAAGDEEQLSGFVILSLAANSFVQVFIASSAAGSLLVHDADFALTLIKAT